MSWLSSFLHPERGYEAGQGQLDKYYQQAQGGMQPYNKYGQAQYANQQKMINALMNPAALQDEWSKGYNESEASKLDRASAQQYGLDAAAAMGLGGSNTALDAIQSGTSNIGAHYKQQYLDDLMKKYMQAAGMSQNIYNTGASTAANMGQNAMNMGQNSAEMAYGRENSGGNMLSGLIGQGIGLVGGYLGGGQPRTGGWSLRGGR